MKILTNKERIIAISKKLGHNHIGSSLTALPIIEEIFEKKKPDEKLFVLSNGHAALALACVMFEDDKKVEEIIGKCMHPTSDWAIPTGSLGHGLGIAVGMALSERKGEKWDKNVYCLISDGECAEGSIWESLRIAHELNLNNLKVYCNANGWASYKEVDLDLLETRLKTFFPVEFRRTIQEEPFIGLNGHYGKAN
jgi:transketolase